MRIRTFTLVVAVQDRDEGDSFGELEKSIIESEVDGVIDFTSSDETLAIDDVNDDLLEDWSRWETRAMCEINKRLFGLEHRRTTVAKILNTTLDKISPIERVVEYIEKQLFTRQVGDTGKWMYINDPDAWFVTQDDAYYYAMSQYEKMQRTK